MSVKDLCVDCGRDTSMGSGLWVDRLGWDDGWKCRDCNVWPCSICGEEVSELEMVDGNAVGVDCCEGKLPKNYYDQEVK